MEAFALSAPCRIVLRARHMKMSKPDCQRLFTGTENQEEVNVLSANYGIKNRILPHDNKWGISGRGQRIGS